MTCFSIKWVFAYELRKDVVTYLLFLLFFWIDLKMHAAPAIESGQQGATKAGEPIELRVDGRRIFVAPAEIVYIEAAGNYIDIFRLDQRHLVRGALTSFEARLGPSGFVRIHRSCLVNKAQVSSVDVLPSGDFQATMKNATVLSGSRRYRERLIT